MPELPEVETIVRTLAPQVLGSIITHIHVLHEKTLAEGQDLLAYVEGARIVSVARRGKLVLVGLQPETPLSQPMALQNFSNTLPTCAQTCIQVGVQPEAQSEVPSDIQTSLAFFPPELDQTPLVLAFHLKMTGRFFVHPPKAHPLKHTRIIFDLAQQHDSSTLVKKDEMRIGYTESQGYLKPMGRLFFDDIRTFGYCRIFWRNDCLRWPFLRSLGLEPLQVSPQAIAFALQKKRTAIKAALLDQKILAGVGNIYADEALFRAGVLPNAKANTLSLARLTLVAESLQAVLHQSIEECGSSIRDYRDAQGNAGAFQNNFFVYGRKGQTCTVCAAFLVTTTVAGRGTTFCPNCQKG